MDIRLSEIVAALSHALDVTEGQPMGHAERTCMIGLRLAPLTATMVEEIRAKILEGAEFNDLARMYDEDSKQDEGGDWGWINRKTLNESLGKMAFSMKTGQVSPVIELGNMYYLLFVEARKNAQTKPLSEVRDEIQNKLIQEERQRRQEEWIARLRKKAYIKMY